MGFDPLLIFPDWEAVAFRVVIPYQHHHYTTARIVGQSTLWTFSNFFLRSETKKRNSKNHAKNSMGVYFLPSRIAGMVFVSIFLINPESP